jgi:cytochrome P450
MAIVDRIIRPGKPEDRMQGFADLAAFCLARIDERRAKPGADLLSQLAGARVHGEPLTEAELQGITAVLMLAGLDTVAAMLAFIARFLAGNPIHRQAMREQPDTLTGAVEEFLRRMAMVNLTREANRDTSLEGVLLKAGDLVVLPTPLCNFPEDGGDWLTVDFDRPRSVHATFGAGPHYCLGSMLARAEIRIFLEEWLTRIPDFALAPDALLQVKVGAAAGLVSLPLVWTPRE